MICNNIQFVSILGEGSYGIVYEAMYNNKKVAIKVLKNAFETEIIK